MHFKILGRIGNVQVLATGNAIKVLARLTKQYGKGPWRKYKGVATIQLEDGTIKTAEIHWYEAHGIGKKDIKIKRFLSS